MKIGNSIRNVGNFAGEGVSRKTDNAKRLPGVGVEPTGLSSHLQALIARVSGGEVVNAARVSKIKQAMSHGRFKVNPDVVADRLIQTGRDLTGACKR